jgi:hypothetical protein
MTIQYPQSSPAAGGRWVVGALIWLSAKLVT